MFSEVQKWKLFILLKNYAQYGSFLFLFKELKGTEMVMIFVHTLFLDT